MIDEKENRNNIVAIILAVMGCLLLIPFLIFAFFMFMLSQNDVKPITDKETQQVSAIVIDYLNRKYGKQDFKLDRVEKRISYNDAVHSYHDGFEAIMLTSMLPSGGYFVVNTAGNDAASTVPRDDFAERYYSVENANFLSAGYKIRLSPSVDSSSIPSDFGQIPTLNELVGFGAVREYMILQWDASNKLYGNDLAGRANYIRELSEKFLKYYEITDDFKFEVQYSENNYTYVYYVNATDEMMRISTYDDKEVYEYER